MITLAGNSTGWWVFLIVAIFVVIGVIVFILRKKIPGLVNYEEEDEETIAKDNLSRILVDVEDEKEEENKEDNSDKDE